VESVGSFNSDTLSGHIWRDIFLSGSVIEGSLNS